MKTAEGEGEIVGQINKQIDRQIGGWMDRDKQIDE